MAAQEVLDQRQEQARVDEVERRLEAACQLEVQEIDRVRLHSILNVKLSSTDPCAQTDSRFPRARRLHQVQRALQACIGSIHEMKISQIAQTAFSFGQNPLPPPQPRPTLARADTAQSSRSPSPNPLV